MSYGPLISVALPAFNAEKTIAQAIRSVLLQTYQNWELLLADDSSSDATAHIARTYSDPRIVILPSEGKVGLSRRLNACIDAARGDYLARMDSDDICYPARFEKQIQFLQAHPAIDLVGCQALVFREAGQPIGKRTAPCQHEQIARHPAHGLRILHPAWMGRLSWFRKNRYDPSAVRCEDQDLLFRALPDSSYANLPDILLGYREDSIEMSRLLPSRWNWVRRTAARRPINILNLASVATVTALKTGLDFAASVSGLHHRLTPQRAQPASLQEINEWNTVWHLSLANVPPSEKDRVHSF